MSMNLWAEIGISALLLLSGGLVLLAAMGLWRLPDFFSRMHAPALASTLAAWSVTLAFIVYFSVREGSLALHAWLIIIVLAITAPVSAMVLARAGLFRQRRAGVALPPPLSRQPDRAPSQAGDPPA
jgi:multicomponent K+:H+ antiporter subunit G